jgi:hypothetical protein
MLPDSASSASLMLLGRPELLLASPILDACKIVQRKTMLIQAAEDCQTGPIKSLLTSQSTLHGLGIVVVTSGDVIPEGTNISMYSSNY